MALTLTKSVLALISIVDD